MRATRRRSRLGALLLFPLALALAPLSAGASTSTSGNAEAIHLYRAAASTMNHLGAYVITQHGYVRIADSIGRHRLVLWSWGQDQFQPGEEATNERLVLVQRDGNVAWILDTVRPVRTCAQGGVCPTILPLQFYITPSRAYVGVVSSGSDAACFTKEQLNNVPYSAGAAWWFAVGQFAKPTTTKKPVTLLESRYANSGQLETERDWLENATHEFTRSFFSVAKSTRHRAFDFAARYHVLSSKPSPPKVVLCS